MSDDTQIEIHTARNPILYSPNQISRAVWLAKVLGSGVFYLLEKPRP